MEVTGRISRRSPWKLAHVWVMLSLPNGPNPQGFAGGKPAGVETPQMGRRQRLQRGVWGGLRFGMTWVGSQAASTFSEAFPEPWLR